jgi:hypothetical protein
VKRALAALLVATAIASFQSAWAGQAPAAASDPDVPVSHRDRVYAAEQFSNTVSVTDPADNKLLGVIRLGDPAPGNFSPLRTIPTCSRFRRGRMAAASCSRWRHSPPTRRGPRSSMQLAQSGRSCTEKRSCSAAIS